MKKITAIPLLLVLATLFSLTACEQKPQAYKQQMLALGTLVDVVIFGTDEQSGHEAVEQVAKTLGEIHTTWHAWEPSSLTRINEKIAAGESIELSPDGQKLIATGIDLSIKSGDLFNPATGKLIEQWGFHSDERDDAPPPSDSAIQAIIDKNPSMRNLIIEGSILSSSNPAVQLDLGGFAKGYAVDLAISELKAMGIENAIVNAGGDLRAIGSKNGKPWRIGIRNPRGTGVIAALNVEGDESVFTSGDYERYFDYHDQRYHHILDPRTGYPAAGAASVTVIHQNATTADAAATALLIAGPEHWYETAQAMGVTQAMLIDKEGAVHMTHQMAKRTYLSIKPKPAINIVDLP